MNARTHLYISPHLDDATLSCGGRMWQQTQVGERVRVVTIFAGPPLPDAPFSPFAQEMHAQWGLADPVAARREEDIVALALLGGEGAYWPYLDCIYRRTAEGGFLYDSEEALFGEVQPADGALVAELTGRLRTLAREQAGTIYAPLAVGRHVDHQIVRRAVTGLEGVVYYEDYPYAAEPGALEAALEGDRSVSSPSPGERRPGEGGIVPPPVVGEVRRGGLPERWQAEHVALSQEALETKIAAIACYGSQLTTLDWADAAQMAAAVRAFAWRVGGDRPAERYRRCVEGELRTARTNESRTAPRT
jgi:LmbE family N-acetylglucosaminyl deacetylase